MTGGERSWKDGPVQRVSVVGTSGSGKTAVSSELAARLGLPHFELDATYHQPGWNELPLDDYRAEVARLVAADAWVVDGNYSVIQHLVWSRADTVVWIDLPRSLVMRRIIRRSVARVVTRQELWNGNRERWRNLLSLDPTQSVIAWAWTQHGKYHQRYGEAAADPAWAHLRFVRLRSPQDVKDFLAGQGDRTSGSAATQDDG
jgi:adenylate kinase family enzyme